MSEVYYLKMNNGDDLLCTYEGEDDDCLYVCQPFVVDATPNLDTGILTTTIMRWIPFDSLMESKITIDKCNVMVYSQVELDIAERYQRTLDMLEEKRKYEAREELIRNLAESANGMNLTIH